MLEKTENHFNFQQGQFTRVNGLAIKEMEKEKCHGKMVVFIMEIGNKIKYYFLIKADGYGVFSHADGDVYKGEFK